MLDGSVKCYIHIILYFCLAVCGTCTNGFPPVKVVEDAEVGGTLPNSFIFNNVRLWLFPSMNFSCSGNITRWIFQGENVSSNGHLP